MLVFPLLYSESLMYIIQLVSERRHIHLSFEKAPVSRVSSMSSRKLLPKENSAIQTEQIQKAPSSEHLQKAPHAGATQDRDRQIVIPAKNIKRLADAGDDACRQRHGSQCQVARNGRLSQRPP